MRSLASTLLASVLLSAPLLAQSQGADTLSPRALAWQAMRAKMSDSVNVTARRWSAWAAAAPLSPAPRFALGLLARYDFRFAEAHAWLDSASAVASSPLWRSAAAREHAAAYYVQGEFPPIPALLGQALADSASLPASELLETKYLALIHRRRMLPGSFPLGALDSLYALTPSSDTLLRSRLLCIRAALDSSDRIARANEAIALMDAIGAPLTGGSCALSIGSILAGSGDAAAFQWFERAAQLARTAHDDPTLAAALQWRGATDVQYGAIVRARRHLGEAIRVAQRIDARNTEAWALLSVSNASRQIGDAAASSAALARAASLFDATGDSLGAWNARLERAYAQMMLGDFVTADRLSRDALEFGRRMRWVSMRYRALVSLSDISVRTRRYDTASAELDSLRALLPAIGMRYENQVSHYDGVLAVRQARNADAVRITSQVLAKQSKGQSLFRYSTLSTLALAYLQSSDTVRAAQAMLDANGDLDTMRDSLFATPQRRVIIKPDSWGGAGSDLDRVLAALVSSSRWLPTAFAVAERARSRALTKGSFGIESVDSVPGEREARARVSATSTSLQRVQRALKPNTALLVYAGGEGGARTALMLITRSTARGMTLASLDSLDRVIVRWLALLESGERGAGAGKQVAAAILSDALRSLVGVTRLIVVPQGPLFRVPFHALPVGTGVLGDRVVVTVSPSVSLAMAYAAEPRNVPASVLAFGAGDTEVQSATPLTLEIGVERTQRGNPLLPLLAAGDEARAAASWGTQSIAYTGPAASEAAFKREARGPFTILHAAAHALTSDQALGANWLILRPDSTEDGYVSGGELGGLSAGMSLVVLSGCRTTGDFGSRGDAIDGLVAPLLARGVRTVVASHWAVSDRWTKVLMERFYRNLASGMPVSDAMNSAQMSLKNSGVPARFWAAFSVIGDGSLTFSSRLSTR
jgi:tetratricopeptide (TPR) repeat protein